MLDGFPGMLSLATDSKMMNKQGSGSKSTHPFNQGRGTFCWKSSVPTLSGCADSSRARECPQPRTMYSMQTKHG